jgi:hypothetical protein
MPLVLEPNIDDSADDYNVLQGVLHIGRIYKRKAALRPDTQWLWALNGVPSSGNDLAITGLSASLEEAMTALNERWVIWLKSAGLTEAD